PASAIVGRYTLATLIVTVSVMGVPTPLNTASSKTSTPPAAGTFGAVKLGVAVVAFCNVTGAPETCDHEYEIGLSGLFVSWLAVPSRVTRVRSSTVRSGPASATGELTSTTPFRTWKT